VPTKQNKTESEYTRRFSKALEYAGALVYPCVGNRYAPSGWPDRLIVSPSKVTFLELKAWNGRLRPDQLSVIKRLTERGAAVYVGRFSEDGTTLQLEDYLGGVVLEHRTWKEVIYWLLHP